MTQAIQVSSPFLTYEIVRLGVDGIGRVSAPRARAGSSSNVSRQPMRFPSRRNPTQPYPAGSSVGSNSRGPWRRSRPLGPSMTARPFCSTNPSPISTCPINSLCSMPHEAVARQGVAVLAVLHDFNLASRYADALALMNKGAIVACGDPASVQRSDLLSDVFAVDLDRWDYSCLRKASRHAFPVAHRHVGTFGEFALAHAANRQLRSAPHDRVPQRRSSSNGYPREHRATN